jgi:YD repeat-containing protein
LTDHGPLLAGEIVTTYEYWPDDLLKTLTKPDGTVTSYEYDGADRVNSIAVRKEGSLVLSYAYTYDRNGNRLSQVEVNGGPPQTTTYTYDDLDRLKTVTYPGGRSGAYGYDPVGNRTSETDRAASGLVVSQKVASSTTPIG